MLFKIKLKLPAFGLKVEIIVYLNSYRFIAVFFFSLAILKLSDVRSLYLYKKKHIYFNNKIFKIVSSIDSRLIYKLYVLSVNSIRLAYSVVLYLRQNPPLYLSSGNIYQQ